MATIGTVNVDLIANTAQFHQEMGKASTSLKTAGETAGRTQRQMADFAAKGIGQIIPAAEGAEHSIAKVIEKLTHMHGALGLIGQGALVVGAALGGFMLGQKLQEEIDNWLRLGETVKQTMERLKQEAEEQKAFSDARAAAVRQLIEAQKKLNDTIREGRAIALETSGGTVGQIEAIGERTKAALERANIEKRLADAEAIERTKTLKDTTLQQQLLAANEKQLFAQRFLINEQYVRDVRKLNDDLAAKNQATFEKETEAYIESIKRRMEARKTIETEAAAAATRLGLGDIFQPFRQAEETRQDITSVAKGFALLLKDGAAFRDLLPEMLRASQQLEERGFFGLLQAVEKQAEAIERDGLALKSIQGSMDAFQARLAELPLGINAATPQMVDLAQKFELIRISATNAAAAVQLLAASIATQGAPPVTAAETFAPAEPLIGQ